MSSTTIFLWSIPIFVILMTAPIITLVCWSAFSGVRKMSNKQAVVVWACIITYYAIFFTQAPKITRPYFQKNSVEVTECVTKRVWKD